LVPESRGVFGSVLAYHSCPPVRPQYGVFG
jgi:hypothetical protein